MEPSFVAMPYLQSHSRDTLAIRTLLDAQEASYAAWRSTRKPIRHAFASSKLNSPLKQLVSHDRPDAAYAKPLWLALLETNSRPQQKNQRRGSKAQGLDSVADARPPPQAASARRSVSTPLLPSLPQRQARGRSPAASFDRRSSPASALLRSLDTPTASLSALPARHRKPSAAQRRLQRHLYDFHSSLVFSIASTDDDSCLGSDQLRSLSCSEQAVSPRDQEPSLPPRPRQQQQHAAEFAIIELPPAERDDLFVISGLAAPDVSVFDDVFATDWTHSDADRIVRDAVERQRIRTELKRWYRVLVLYFRQLTATTALALHHTSNRSTASPHFAADVLQLPNRLNLLEDLNVPCVDPAAFGLGETPLRRDGLIAFFMHAARMYAAHAPDPMRFRMLSAEGIELSAAVRALMEDHVAVYAQVLDPRHFRDVFLRDVDGGRKTKRLRHILAKHDTKISSFFFEAIQAAASATTHSSSSLAQAAGQERMRGRSVSHRHDHRLHHHGERLLVVASTTTMSFHAFVTMLRGLHVIPSIVEARPRKASLASGELPKPTAVTIDDNRAMRIFQQCLDLRSEFSGQQRQQQLTYLQFVEALLRVTLVRHETAICRGGVDVCPGQPTSAICRCLTQTETAARAYDHDAFASAVDAFFGEIHATRGDQQHRGRSGGGGRRTSLLPLQHAGSAGATKTPQRHHSIVAVVNPRSTPSVE